MRELDQPSTGLAVTGSRRAIALTASSVSAVIVASSSACAPVSTITAWSAATSSIVEIRSPTRCQQRGVLLRRRLRRDREQRRGLAFAEVVADRLARERGVAERAEQVVAELEGIAEREAVARTARARRSPSRPASAAPEVQRPLDRVLARLVPRDRSGPSRGRRRRAPCRARSRYWPTLSSMRSSFHTADRVGGGAAAGAVGVDEREVADEDGDALAEAARLRRASRRRRGASANARCAVRTPRRVPSRPSRRRGRARTRAAARTRRPASTTSGSSGSPPAPTKPQWQNAGRSRLPPASTKRTERLERCHEVGVERRQRSISPSSSRAAVSRPPLR